MPRDFPLKLHNFYGIKLLLVEDLQEFEVNRFAVPVHSSVVQVQGFGNQALVACHDVDQVSEGLRGVALCSDVNMNFKIFLLYKSIIAVK